MKNTDTIKITLNINEDLHEFIKQIQLKIKEKDGKTIALSEIILDFAIKGIEKQTNSQFTQEISSFTQKNNEFTLNYNEFAHNFRNNQTNLLKPETAKELKEFKQELMEREDKLRNLEFELNDRHDELFEKQHTAIELKEQALLKIQEVETLKMTVLFNKNELEVLKSENKYLKEKQIRKDELHFKEKQELLSGFDNFKDIISNVEKSNERMVENLTKVIQAKKETTPLDYIERLLPYGIAIYALSQNQNPKKFDQLKNEVRTSFNLLSNSEKQKLKPSTITLIENFLK